MGAGCGSQAGAAGGGNDDGDPELMMNQPSRPLQATLPQLALKKRLTHAQLLQERQAFWTSRVSGNGAVWNTLEQVATMILDSNDVETAGAILMASGITTPHGDLSEVFDERGARYEVPRYCFQNPVNLVNGIEETQSPRKGKFQREEIEIKFRVGNGSETDDTTCTVSTTHTTEEIVAIFRANSEKAAAASRIRLFFYGREMQKGDMCAACGVRKSGLVILSVLYE